jgi:Uma2 family endonuclease
MVNLAYDYLHLPTEADLPDSDETPVDNELQNDIPNLLLNILLWMWGDRSDWFWGVDMCIYYEPNIEQPKESKSIVPDAFLSLGVNRHVGEGGRLSYVLWKEQVLPILFLEVVSKEYNGEYDRKLSEYQALGILYYVIYNPLSERTGVHKKHQSLEVYKLVDGKYELMPLTSLLQEDGKGKMVWMPEIGLGIGCEVRSRSNWSREWVYWYDRFGKRYPTPEERANTAEAIAEQEKLAKEQAELAQQKAEALFIQEKLAKEQAEALLKKYRDRFGDIPE